MSVRSVFPFRAVVQSATPADRTSRRSSSVVLAHACERARACVCVREKRPAKKRAGTLNKEDCTARTRRGHRRFGVVWVKIAFGVRQVQSPPGNRENRGKAGVCGAKILWSSQKFQPLMSRFPSGAVEFSPYLAEFSPCLAEISPFLAEFSPCLAEIFPCVAEFSPYLAECLPVWRNFARSGGFFAWSGGVFAFYLAWWAFD